MAQLSEVREIELGSIQTASKNPFHTGKRSHFEISFSNRGFRTPPGGYVDSFDE